MHPSWLSVVPPLIVLLTALITRRLHISLIIGIISAALIATSGAPIDSISLIGKRIFQQVSDKDSIYMYSFLVVIGALIVLICITGGIYAFSQAMQKRFTSKKAVETTSLFLSAMVGIDDYLSSLTVGHVMQPLADRFGIARTKLAYMIHTMAGPFVILVPISSWIATIISNLDLSGVSLEKIPTTKIYADPFFVYIKTIPFIFYSIFTIFSVCYLVRKQFSFGPMYHREQQALQQAPTTTEQKQHHINNYSLADIFVPIGTLLISIIIGILYTGGYYLLGGTNSLIDAFKKNPENSLVLLCASLVTFIITFFLGLSRKKVSVQLLPTIIKDGIILMGPAILMLLFAATLGLLLRYDLGTGTYLAEKFLGSLPVTLLPPIFFITSAITALLTGTSWGTIALMLPIAIPMLLSMVTIPLPTSLISIPILLPTLGAIFSGAVSGDHLSPISETTIMAATGSGSQPFDHAYTQFPYAIPAFISSAVAFLISGLLINLSLWLNLSISLGIGLLLCTIMLHNMNKKWK